MEEALGLYRQVIHTTALSGTLGRRAKARVDPFVILPELKPKQSVAEEEFKPQTLEYSIIQLARKMFGVKHRATPANLRMILPVLIDQHRRVTTVQGSPNIKEVADILSERLEILALNMNPVVRNSLGKVHGDVLMLANRIHVIAQNNDSDPTVNMNNRIISWRVHEALAGLLLQRYSDDPFLNSVSGLITEERKKLRRQVVDPVPTLEQLAAMTAFDRGIVHAVALNDTLGEHARDQVDPFAILPELEFNA